MRSRSPLFYGWVVVATGAVGLLLGGAPIAVFSFGVFFQSFSREFHAGRAAIALAFTVHNFVGAAFAPFLGWLVDRWGARKVILPGQLLLGLILVAALTMGRGLLQLYLFYGALGAASVATAPVSYGIVVSRWFNRRRGLALGLMMVGLGVGAIVMPPIAQRLIAAFGWRSAFALVGCAVGTIPIALVARYLTEDPRDRGLWPDGEAASADSSAFDGLEWAQVWRTRSFWLMICAFALAAAAAHACFIHLPQLLADRGVTAANAALASSVLGVAVLVGRVVSGYLVDRFFAPYVAFALFAQAAAGIGLLLLGGTGVLALAGAFSVGLALGAEIDVIAYLMSRYFGLRCLGTALGVGFAGFVLAGGIGPLLVGIGFDHFGSYRVPLTGFLVAMSVAAILVMQLGPYRYQPSRRRDEGPLTRARAGAEA